MRQHLRSRNIGNVLNLRKLVPGFYSGCGKLAVLKNQQSWPGSRCVAGVLEGVLLFRPWPRKHLASAVLIGVLSEVLPEFSYRQLWKLAQVLRWLWAAFPKTRERASIASYLRSFIHPKNRVSHSPEKSGK